MKTVYTHKYHHKYHHNSFVVPIGDTNKPKSLHQAARKDKL